MSNDKSVSNIFTPSSTVIHPHTNLQEDWDFELDLMGTAASIELLERHLDKAPDPQSANAQFLKGFIASHVHTH